MRKLDWGSIGNFAGQICGAAAYGLMLMLSCKVVDYVTEDYISSIGYDEAVGAIMKSGMYSNDKCEAAKALKRDEDAEYYRAIIHIAKDSRLYSHDKVDLIKGLG